MNICEFIYCKLIKSNIYAYIRKKFPLHFQLQEMWQVDHFFTKKKWLWIPNTISLNLGVLSWISKVDFSCYIHPFMSRSIKTYMFNLLIFFPLGCWPLGSRQPGIGYLLCFLLLKCLSFCLCVFLACMVSRILQHEKLKISRVLTCILLKILNDCLIHD